jgi:hypothetical protein
MTQQKNATPPDPFNPSAFRIQETASTDSANYRKILVKLVMGKPPKSAFVRGHPTVRLDAYLYEHDTGDRDSETYLITPAIVPFVPKARAVNLRLAATLQGGAFAWAVPLGDGKKLAWWETHQAAADLANNEWVRMSAGADMYDIVVAENVDRDPVWPDEITGAADPVAKMLQLVFGKENIIYNQDHPVIRELMGDFTIETEGPVVQLAEVEG